MAYKNFTRTGFSEFRDGEEVVRSKRRKGNKPVKMPVIAALKRKPIFEGQRRENVIGKTVEVLSAYRLSKFQYQAAATHGLRRAMVLNGHRFTLAEMEAHRIVAEALARIRAIRPTYEQGQPEYTHDRETCLKCNGALDTESNAPWRYSFCTEYCRDQYQLRRETALQYWNLTAIQQAYFNANAALLQKRDCIVCTKTFQPRTPDAKTCSPTCSAQIRADAVPFKNCLYCNKTFRGRSAKSLYCCSDHADAHRREKASAMPPRVCAADDCDNIFEVKYAGVKSLYCSTRCSGRQFARNKREAERVILPERVCAADGCTETFIPRTKNSACCSDRCRRKYYNKRRSKACAE